MTIITQEERTGWVTVQNRTYMGGVLFDINSQWQFDMVAIMEVGCGCNGQKKQHVKHYRLMVKGHAMFIDEKYLVETSIPIPLVSQSFDNARRNQHLSQPHDMSEIVAHPDPAKIWYLANKVQPKDRWKH